MKTASLLLFLCAVSQAIVAQMTHEETVIRTAYAKASYAVDLHTAYEAAQANPKITATQLSSKVEGASLRFQLSNFACGNLGDLANAKFADAFPDQYGDSKDVIYDSPAGLNLMINGNQFSMETATARWGRAPDGAAPDMTMGQILPELERELGVSPLTSYCKFTVTATLAERARTYKAAFLFGPYDEPAALDPVSGVGGGALAHFLSRPVYPEALLRAPNRNPVLIDYLTTNQKSGNACRSGDACCDLDALQCGVFSADLNGRQP
jgi:hypothetical protein